ncbi:MAG: hypothetical protein WEB09_09390 [Nitriliruptor sp.]
MIGDHTGSPVELLERSFVLSNTGRGGDGEVRITLRRLGEELGFDVVDERRQGHGLAQPSDHHGVGDRIGS